LLETAGAKNGAIESVDPGHKESSTSAPLSLSPEVSTASARMVTKLRVEMKRMRLEIKAAE
jgi:hypothetical protein